MVRVWSMLFLTRQQNYSKCCALITDRKDLNVSFTIFNLAFVCALGYIYVEIP